MPKEIKSAVFHANGISGTPFYAAIVTDPWGMGQANEKVGGDFLIITFEDSDHTVALKIDNLAAGDVSVQTNDWPGYMLRRAIIEKAKEASSEN
jgi:hypothetical protein